MGPRSPCLPSPFLYAQPGHDGAEVDPDSGDSDDDDMMDESGSSLAAAGGMAGAGGLGFAFALPGANLTAEGTSVWAPLPQMPLTPLFSCYFSVSCPSPPPSPNYAQSGACARVAAVQSAI